MFDKQFLSEGSSRIDRKEETARLVTKWERTGLLEGLNDSRTNQAKSNMARLLENQAAALLTESSQVADIIGFQNVAFPMVRRVFAGLISNELVSVQPMSLPSGLLFYLDYRFDTVKAGNRANDFAAGGSLFGDQTAPGTENLATGGMYNLANSFSLREKIATASFSGTIAAATDAQIDYDPELSGVFGVWALTVPTAYSNILTQTGCDSSTAGLKQWMPVSGSSTNASASTDGTPVRLGSGLVVYRRHTKRSGNDVVFIVSGAEAVSTGFYNLKISYPVVGTLAGGTSGSLALPEWESDMGATPTPVIPEIDLRIQSVAVTSQTRKLRAKWTPELAQDLAAYQNLDAEVELTQVLSEAIALEIDREILADLLWGATGANYYWSRKPGKFVNMANGNTESGASFTGTVREWYETLVETCLQVANTIHRKTLRGAANWMVTSPTLATIFEASVLYKPVLSLDPKETQFSLGTEKMGTVNSRFTLYKDPYFPQNKILIGYKGGSFLETGYVYAPYVPLIVTPTIYGPEDFVPRKGVMTRYAKKMVRSDFFGTVTVMDLLVV
jgi:hypothetical protein